jgi:hypothetical protein
VALVPIALLLAPVAVALSPFARLLRPVAVAFAPLARLPCPVAVAAPPFAMANSPVAVAKSPRAAGDGARAHEPRAAAARHPDRSTRDRDVVDLRAVRLRVELPHPHVGPPARAPFAVAPLV